MKIVADCKLVLVVGLAMIFNSGLLAYQGCDNKLFSVSIDDSLSISDALENLSDNCNLSIVIKDAGAKKMLDKKLYYIKLKNITLGGYLDTILKDNGLNYELSGNKLSISYLMTRTYRLHYISSSRAGSSKTDIVVADSDRGRSGSIGKSGSGISIMSENKFEFWQTVKTEVQKILISAGDNTVHYTKVGNAWISPDGQKWEYNPMEPVINPEAGMITVTGTPRQIERVGRYMTAMIKQIKEQVLIDVRILTVTFSDVHTTGVDWSQLYGLQNIKIDAVAINVENLKGLQRNSEKGVDESVDWEGNSESHKSASGIRVASSATVNELIKFLKTQGEVRSISSPRVRTLNNQQAVISAGKELFYKIKTSTKLDGNMAEGEQINSVFAGVLLDITPEVDARGMITLKINPSITETLEPVEGGGTRTMPPDLIRRQIASVIKVADGDHAILGGLISTKSSTKSSKVPLLGDIPLLEYAFKKETNVETTEEMVIIITPHIIKNNNEVSLDNLGYRRLK